MSANTVNNQLYLAEAVTADPGSAGTITVEKSLSICNIVTAGAEARTLARPNRAGVVLTLVSRTAGGDCTITVTGGHNAAGETTIVLTAIKQFVVLQSFMDSSGVFFWRTISNSNVANAPVAAGAALTTQLTSITHTAPGTPDYALQNLVQNTGFGFVTADEGNTVLSVILNLQVRLAEVEARLEAANIVAAN